MVAPGSRGVTQALFVETTTGAIYSTRSSETLTSAHLELLINENNLTNERSGDVNCNQLSHDRRVSSLPVREQVQSSASYATGSFPYLSVDAVFDNTDYWATLVPQSHPTEVQVRLPAFKRQIITI